MASRRSGIASSRPKVARGDHVAARHRARRRRRRAGILVGLPAGRRRGIGVAGVGRPGARRRPRPGRRRRGRPVDAERAVADLRPAGRGRQAALRPGRRVGAPGPLRERLRGLSGRLDDGIDESWRIARRGHEIVGAIAKIDTESAEARARRPARSVGGARRRRPERRRSRRWRPSWPRPTASTSWPSAAATGCACSTPASTSCVARTVEVSVGSGDTEVLGDDVDGLVDELEALRIAMEEPTGSGPRFPADPDGDERRHRRALGRHPLGRLVRPAASPDDRDVVPGELAAPIEPRRRHGHGALALTGLLRVTVFGYVIGQTALADAYTHRQRDPEHRLRAAHRRRAVGDPGAAVHVVRRARRRGVDERRDHRHAGRAGRGDGVAVLAAPLIFGLYTLDPAATSTPSSSARSARC